MHGRLCFEGHLPQFYAHPCISIQLASALARVAVTTGGNEITNVARSALAARNDVISRRRFAGTAGKPQLANSVIASDHLATDRLPAATKPLKRAATPLTDLWTLFA